MNIGDKVVYIPSHGNREKGIIKSFNDDETIAFVVYKCGDNWNDYQNYTGCSTNVTDLVVGWEFAKDDRLTVEDPMTYAWKLANHPRSSDSDVFDNLNMLD